MFWRALSIPLPSFIVYVFLFSYFFSLSFFLLSDFLTTLNFSCPTHLSVFYSSNFPSLFLVLFNHFFPHPLSYLYIYQHLFFHQSFFTSLVLLSQKSSLHKSNGKKTLDILDICEVFILSTVGSIVFDVQYKYCAVLVNAKYSW